MDRYFIGRLLNNYVQIAEALQWSIDNKNLVCKVISER